MVFLNGRDRKSHRLTEYCGSHTRHSIHIFSFDVSSRLSPLDRLKSMATTKLGCEIIRDLQTSIAPECGKIAKAKA
jgi:hypothetical protein